MKPKRTLEQLQQIEHAIKNKYGDIAIADPRQFWNKEKEAEYSKQLTEQNEKYRSIEENEEKIEKDGFFISKRLLIVGKKERCEVCKKLFCDKFDSIYMNKYTCCQGCFVVYVEGREDRWLSGWRPNTFQER